MSVGRLWISAEPWLMDGWRWWDTIISGHWSCETVWNSVKLVQKPWHLVFFCMWKAPNFCGAKGCEWLWEGLYKHIQEMYFLRQQKALHLPPGSWERQRKNKCICGSLVSFARSKLLSDEETPLLAVWINEHSGISLSPVLPCTTGTWLKPQLRSFEIRFHCALFPVSILQGRIFMSCRLPSLRIPSSGKCAIWTFWSSWSLCIRSLWNTRCGHARPAHACPYGWWWGANAVAISYESYEQLCAQPYAQPCTKPYAIYAAHAQPCAPPHSPVLLTSRPVLPPDGSGLIQTHDKWSWIIPGREWKKSRSRVGFKLWRRAWRSCPWCKKRATWFRPSIVESMHISSMRQTFAPKFKQSSSAWKNFEI